MTAKAKIAVSLPAELVAAARRAVGSGRASNVSAYVEQALTAQVEQDDLDDWVAEVLAASGGPMTVKEQKWADSVLGGSPARRSTPAR